MATARQAQPRAKQTRNRTRKLFDASKVNDETLVSIADISDYMSLTKGYLYNVRATKLPRPVINGRSLRFRWRDVKKAIADWHKE